jgi:hypothetical protein
MAYSLMLKRSRNNGMRPKTSNRMGDNNEGRLDSKVKIPAQQYYEKYMTLARESMAVGDRIAAEGFYQHAEHYLRLMNEFKPMALEVESADKDDLTQDGMYPIDEDTILAVHPAVMRPQLEPEPEDL